MLSIKKQFFKCIFQLQKGSKKGKNFLKNIILGVKMRFLRKNRQFFKTQGQF